MGVRSTEEVRQAGLQLDKALPKSGAAQSDRGAALEKQVQAAQAKRRDTLAKLPVENPSANAQPKQNR
jgi:hypothetical protein